ncbi:MAG: insulinase family protein [Bacteroidales bacterium]|nr:insulinase family protein [Bacteroidales bacterium]
MKKMQYFIVTLAVLFLWQGVLAQKNYKFEQVPGDPLNARIYTLDNGLKVYMTVYKDEPRIQTYIAVKVGSKNDPAETTGLAHYFEHMMFKGTPNFGTLDWEKEKVMIEKIEQLFEKYRKETAPTTRAAIYRVIDSLSHEASKLAIPNEYDKLMKSIGSRGTNAGTSNDYTIYIENVPSNQLEKWAIVQADRFAYPVLRLLHTELETVYEEKNMSLTNDGRRASEAMLKALYPNHPYGQQTTLGEAEHLKNPSMKNIREFYAKYYVPGNMVVAISGDFDPDQAIGIIDRYMGKLEPKPIPEFTFKPESPLTEPKIVEVVGLEAENIRLAYRFAGIGTHEALMADMLAMMLSNGKAGLIDLNVNQKQLTQRANAYFMSFNDYSALTLSASNKSGQTLDQAKNILLEQVELLKKGEFPDWMLEAAINNLKLRELKRFESNAGRAMALAQSFLRSQDWKETISYINQLGTITKQELLAFANEKLGNNYVVVYKRQGAPQDIVSIEKPPITPNHINRDVESDFLKMVKDQKVNPLKPVFVDYEKDITRVKTKTGLSLLYVPNTENATFNLFYYFPFGSDHDKMINLAAQYLQYLGTSTLTPEEIGQEFYKLACSFSVNASRDETYVSISGLSENQGKAMLLLENLMADCQPNDEALGKLVDNILKGRNDAKANQNANFQALVSYATYGPVSPTTNIIDETSLRALTPNDLIQIIRTLNSYPHEAIYYGPTKPADMAKLIVKMHKVPAKFLAIPKPVEFKILETTSDRLLFAHYDATQSYLQTVSRGVDFTPALNPIVTTYNGYFGGGMNTIVFQEMRERRGLAYTARSRYNTPDTPDQPFTNTSFIATQNDKIVDAFNAFNELFNQMPASENSFRLAREAIITDIETNRITKLGLIWNYFGARKMGYKEDIRKELYHKVPSFTLEDVVKFNEQYIANQPKTYVVLGNEKDMDFDKLHKLYGTVRKLSKEEIFGY